MYKKILVPVDLEEPESWREVLSTGSILADRFGASLTICSVVSEMAAIKSGEWLPISVEQMLFDARARLEGLASGLEENLNCAVEVVVGSISGGILQIADRIDADLIVLVSHQPATRDYLRAANAIRVARRASCSVLIARRGRA